MAAHRMHVGASVLLAALTAIGGPRPALAGERTATNVATTAWSSPADAQLPAPTSTTRCTFSLAIHAAGTAVQLQLENIADEAVQLSGVFVAAGAATVTVSVGGTRTFTIPAHARVLTDVFAVPLAFDAPLTITLHDVSPGVPVTAHDLGMESGSCSTVVGLTTVSTPQAAPWFVEGVIVVGSAATRDVAVLGDSLSDGLYLPASSDHRWTDLVALRGNGTLEISNASIQGNRLCDDTHWLSGMHRLQADALSLPGITTLVVEEGTNDLASGRSAAKLLRQYRTLVAIAHRRHIRVVGATITPRAGSTGWTRADEKQRLIVNATIRHRHVFDEVADFDAAVRGGDPSHLLGLYDYGDHLHLNAAGQEALASAAAPLLAPVR